MGPEEIARQLAKRRQEARQAMEDERHREARAREQELIVKKRRDAMRAMEGEVWRKRREEREGLAKRANQTAAAAAQSETERKAAAERAAREAKEKAEQEAAARIAEREKRIDDIDYSEKVIDRLKKEGLAISPLRTLKSDMARAVREEGMSVAKVALAEQAKKSARGAGAPQAPQTAPKKSHLGTLLLLLVLVLAGAGGFVWWQRYGGKTAPPPPVITAPKALVFAEESAALELPANPSAAELRAAISAVASFGNWQVKQLYPVERGDALTWNQARPRLGLNPPDLLLRSLENEYMLGLIRQGNAAQPFLLLKTSFYNNALAGLRDWEASMPQSLFPLFHPANPSVPRPVFSDKLIRNKDGRRLVAADGQTVLFYAFLDNETILLTVNEAVFSDIFSRYLSTR